MKKILVGLILVLVVFTGCQRETVLQKGRGDYNFNAVMVIGNHAYIPLELEGRASDNVVQILGVQKEYEKAHPELKMIS